MFYYIDQPRTPYFHIGLLNTEFDVIVRSIETESGRWTLVVAEISVDAYPFLAFSDHSQTELGSSNREASPSAGKNTRAVLVPCCTCKCVSTADLDHVDISKVPGCQLLWPMSSQWGSHKLVQGLVSHELTAYLCFWHICSSMNSSSTLSLYVRQTWKT